MRSMVGAIALFAIALGLHIVIWRRRRPAGEYTWLVTLYLGALAVWAAVLGAAHVAAIGWIAIAPWSTFESVNLVVLYLALVAAFAVTYSAIQADSPTMTILLEIEAAEGGVTRDELRHRLTDEMLVLPRLSDLVRGRLVVLRAGRYVAATRGRAVARLYILFRALMRMERGG